MTFGLNLPAVSLATCHGVSDQLQQAETGPTYQSFGLFDVRMSKEKLAVQIREVDSVKIHDMNLSKASGDEVLKEFTSNTSSADYEDARLRRNQ